MKNKLFFKIFILIAFASAPIARAQDAENNKKEIFNLLEKKRSYNISKGYGYCIQIYYGNEITAKKNRHSIQCFISESTYNISL